MKKKYKVEFTEGALKDFYKALNKCKIFGKEK